MKSLSQRTSRRLVAGLALLALSTACSAADQGKKHDSSNASDNQIGDLVSGGSNSPSASASPSAKTGGKKAHGSKSSASPSASGSSNDDTGSSGDSSTSLESNGVHYGPATDTRTGRGVTATTIKLGFMYSDDQSSAAASAGNTKSYKDAQKRVVQSLIDYVNKQGGIAGRKIEPVWYKIVYVGSKTDAQRAQEQCATYTEDNKIFAAGPFPTATHVQAACFHNVGSIMVTAPYNDGTWWDNAALGTYGDTLWSPENPSQDRGWQMIVKQAAAAGYFKKGAKVGLVTWDTPEWRRSNANSLIPALKAAGVKLADTAYIRPVYDLGSLAGGETDAQNGVLKFKSEGIDHVLVNSSVNNWYSMAENQGYRPRYAGFSSLAQNAEKSTSGRDITAQYAGALMYGWNPFVDLASSLAGPGSAACLNIPKKAGIAEDDVHFTFSQCSYLFFVKAALENAPSFTPAGFAQGVKKITTSLFSPVLNPGVNFSSGRQDGTSVARLATFDYACYKSGKTLCWHYTGSPINF